MLEKILDINDIIFGEKLEDVEYFERPAVYGIVFNSDGKIATIKTPRGYFLPGGGIEKNENHKQCLEREFMEETGYEIDFGNYIGKSSLYHKSKSNRYIFSIGFFYYAELKNKKNNGIEEDHELVWLEPNECINNLNLEHQSWAVTKALNKNKQ